MPTHAGKPGHWEADTQPLPRVMTDTLELPVVAAPPPVAQVPVQPRLSRRRGRPGRWLAGIVVLVVVAAAAVGFGLARGGRHPGSGTRSVLAIRAVSSVDPAGGSGWRRSGDGTTAVWRTQHYRTAGFGGLKPGVGLLIDLGTARRVASVRTAVAVAGTTVELRAGKSAGSAPDGFRLVASAAEASGRTTLAGTAGGASRYWLLWVPRLGRDGGGYSAELGGITVRG